MAVVNENVSKTAKLPGQKSQVHHDLSDNELIERSKQGDREAFSQLAERYLKMIYAVALAITRNHEDAEDACQDALIKAFRYINSLRDNDKFGGWLRNIVKQEVYGRFRKQSRFWSFLDDFFVEVNSSPVPVEVPNNQKLYHQQLFDYSINHLTTKAREIVLMHYMSELSCEQIAQQTGLSTGAVKSHLFKARNKMLKALSDIGVHSLEEL